MKTNENLAKIVSTGMALVLCFTAGLFALLMIGHRAAPAHAYVSIPAAAITSSPSQGPPGTKITVTGSNIPPPANTGTPETATFGYSSSLVNCSSINTNVGSPNPTFALFGGTPPFGTFTGGTFTWPMSGTTVGTLYSVCVQINGATGGDGLMLACIGCFRVTGSASVSVDSSSYKVGDVMTVSGTGFPASTAIKVELQSSDGASTTTLGNVNTDINGAFSKHYTVPAHPLNSVVAIVTYGNGQQATSSSFTINAKAIAKPKPTPTPAPPPPTPLPPPPAMLVATPTLVPVPTATPNAVPTNTPAPAPSPTVALAPTAAPVVVTHTTNTASPGGRLPLILVIVLGMLIALGILSLVGQVLMRRYLSPVPLPKMPPSGALPWTRSQDNSLQQNTIINGTPFAQTIPFDSPFPPGNGEFAQGPWNAPQPQPVPFNSPFGPGNGEFTPDPGNDPQPVPFGGPYQFSNIGFAPTNVPQEPFPPNDWFAPPD